MTQTGGFVTPENQYLIFEYNTITCRFEVNGDDPLSNKKNLDFDNGEQFI